RGNHWPTAEQEQEREETDPRDPKIDFEPVPNHEKEGEPIASHQRYEKEMQLIRGHIFFFPDAIDGHPHDSADPHRENHPAQRGGFRPLERMEQADEKHRCYHAPAEIFKDAPELTNEIVSNL